MGELKNRAYFNTTLPKELIKKIRELADLTRIPMSRLAEEAWSDLLKKYAKKLGGGT